MISNASTVQVYIEELPIERNAAIEKLRAVCRRHLKGYEERMAYGGPGYKRNGAIEVGFASQKQYISLHVLKKGVVDEFRAALPGAIGRLLRRTAESEEAPC